MNSYIINFAVYSFAMAGFLAVILMIYKKSISRSAGFAKSSFLQIKHALKLSPVKTIYFIKAGRENFLIAADTASTTMLAKLENIPEEAEEETASAEMQNKNLTMQLASLLLRKKGFDTDKPENKEENDSSELTLNN